MRSMIVAGWLPALNAVILLASSAAGMPLSARISGMPACAEWQPVHDDAPAGTSAPCTTCIVRRKTAVATETRVAVMNGLFRYGALSPTGERAAQRFNENAWVRGRPL